MFYRDLLIDTVRFSFFSIRRNILIGLFLLPTIAVQATSLSPDSVGLERRNGETYVLHQIDRGETLFSLSRRYRVSIQEIKEANPEKEISSLPLGDTLRAPLFPELSRGEKTLHTVQEGETLYRLAKQYEVTTEQIKNWNTLGLESLKINQLIVIYHSQPLITAVDTTRYLTHQVQEGETLYAISRAYQVPIAELLERNNLETESIKFGQLLTIREKNPVPIPEVKVEPTASTARTPTRRMSRSEALRRERERYERIRQEEEETIASYNKVSSNGFASVIEGKLNTQKYLGLHRTAPVGTILRVRNEMNDMSIFVRVVGKLPDTGVNNNIEIRLTQSAYDKLGGINRRFPVEITYVE
ncbi:MAG: LysM peptidoglycan-binding domain-containing protein [Bacteroidota bacterium]